MNHIHSKHQHTDYRDIQMFHFENATYPKNLNDNRLKQTLSLLIRASANRAWTASSPASIARNKLACSSILSRSFSLFVIKNEMRHTFEIIFDQYQRS